MRQVSELRLKKEATADQRASTKERKDRKPRLQRQAAPGRRVPIKERDESLASQPTSVPQRATAIQPVPASDIERPDYELFDETFYLETYPDIAAAVKAGTLASPWEHYVRHGRREGRLCCLFDETFYASSYPLAKDEVASGLAESLLDHYQRLGRHRGYLPYLAAERPDNPLVGSRFGGLWADAPNAADLIEGKLETRQIDEEQAKLLRDWTRNGYIILRGAVPDHEINKALKDFDKAYGGGFDNLKFDCPSVSNGTLWRKEVRESAAKGLDLHWFSSAIRDVMFSPKVTSFLELLFQSKALASQSLAFYRGSGQDPHQDSAYVPYTLQRGLIATWIAFEDVVKGAGELYYYEGSHRLNDFVYAGRYKSVREATRKGSPPSALQSDIESHVRSLAPRCEAAGMAKKTLRIRRGDVLFWHADLVHGGLPISTKQTRKSLVTHYCPRRLVPLFMEVQKLEILKHGEKGYYVSSVYGNG